MCFAERFINVALTHPMEMKQVKIMNSDKSPKILQYIPTLLFDLYMALDIYDWFMRVEILIFHSNRYTC